MQYKKDEIKERIYASALTVFSQKGYGGTKISEVALNAGVSVGNIYRYYKSKEELFHAILPESFLESVKNLLGEKISIIKERELKLPQDIDKLGMFNDEFIFFMIENKERILILLDNSKGTKFENVRMDIINFILKTVKERYDVRGTQEIKKDKLDFLLKIIYENILMMTLNILKISNNVNEIKNYLKTIHSYHLFGITSLFE